MASLTVKVWSETLEISLYQKSKSVWIAVGTYMGERLEVKGRSESQAAAAWAAAAKYKGG